MSGTEYKSLARTYPRQSRVVVILLLCALGLFIAGIFRPFTSVTKLWVFENQISVYAGLITLWNEDELFLFMILLVFTVIFPFVKILSLLTLWLKGGLARDRVEQLYRFVAQLGKWSMLDVFIVAILVLTVKSGGLANIRIEHGLFLFFCSVMLTQIASAWTGRIARRQVGDET
jgi:paraquat-inducible protein A